MLCLYLSTYTIYKCAFAPQRRAIFRHLNFKKRPVAEVFVAFWLGKVFGPTLTCIFSTSEFEKVIRDHQFLFWILTWKRSSCRSGVQFFFLRWIATSAPAALASLLFDPSDPPIIEKNFATFVTLVCIFFLLILLSSDSTFFWLCLSALLFMFYCRKFDF